MRTDRNFLSFTGIELRLFLALMIWTSFIKDADTDTATVTLITPVFFRKNSKLARFQHPRKQTL